MRNCLLLIALIATTGFAQQVPERIRFEHLTVADGLPENSILCILQDHQGFIWMGTQNGLVRYDGDKIVAFHYDPDNSSSFKGRLVGTLMEDRQGDIWIGAENLFRFERTTQRFIEYPDKNSNKIHGFPDIEFIHQDKQGNIWTLRNMDRERVLNRFDPKSNSWTYFDNDSHNTHTIAGRIIPDGIIEDNSGKIWTIGMGSKEDILQWLDPKKDKFVPYASPRGSNLPGNLSSIWQISLGGPGELYLSSLGDGLFILNTEDGRIRQFRHNVKDKGSLLNDTTFTTYRDSRGQIWVSTFSGMDRFDPANKTFVHYLPFTGDKYAATRKILYNPLESPKGDIWFQDIDGMYFYHRESDRFIRYSPDKKQEGALWNSIRSSLIDRSGVVWFGSYNTGLNKESRINQFQEIKNIPGISNSPLGGAVNSIYEPVTEPGIIWLGTNTSLDRYDKKTGSYTHYQHNEQDKNSISIGAITSIAEDRKGRFWVSTIGGGLNLMDRDSGRFIHFENDSTNSNSLISNGVLFIKPASDGSLWIGTDQGLDHFNFDDKKFTYYGRADTSYTPELFQLLSQYQPAKRLVASITHPANNVNKSVEFKLSKATELLVIGEGEISKSSIADWGWIEDSSGKIVWDMTQENTVGDGSGRIRCETINLAAGKYRLRYKSDNDYSYGHWYRAPPLHTEFWGIQVLKISTDEDRLLKQELLKRYFNGLLDLTIFCITEDSKKNIWIGTRRGGVSILDPITGRFTHFMDYFKGPRFITGSILEDKKTGNFWVGDYLFGLLLINGKGEVLKRYNSSNGLLANSVLGIQRDSAGILWISTYNGISRFDPRTEKFHLYDKRNGLQSLDFNRMAFCQTTDGEIYFGGSNGLNAFYPEQIKLDTQIPPVVFTDLDIAGRPVTIGKDGQMPVHISEAKEITLPYYQNDLGFHFTSLVFDRGEESIFAYRLSPGDGDWIQVGTHRQARYSNLSPGSYCFSVKAANADGIWNEKGISILITILPPWWKTWWAYLLYAFVLIGSIFGMVAYRSAKLKRENRILESKVEMRTNQLQISIESLKSTQAQLIQSEKMASLGELTAGIAHEIQNPLNFVNNFSEVNTELIDELQELRRKEMRDIKDEDNLLIDIRENELKINHHGKRADAIVKGMLQHSRSNTGIKELTDINSLADEYLRLAYHGLRAKDKDFNAELKTGFDNAIGKINVIPQDMGRVLLNLYNNAFYAVGEKKKSAKAGYEPIVSVDTRKVDNRITISVRDNGNGITQKVIDKIFQPFFTTKPTGQGTGLGLSMSYDIVKAHGGDIKVETKEGEFTEFVIQLPD